MAVSSWIIATRFPLMGHLQFSPVVSTPLPTLSFQARDKSVKLGSSGGSFPRLCVGNSSSSTASLNTHQGIWEDPDDGSGSEYEEEEEEEEEEMEENDESGFQEGNDVGIIDKYARNQYEEDLVKEVEQLLGPEEKAILQQNASPNLRKISTAKWKPLQTLALSLQIPFMDKLLEDGLNIDEVDKDGHTALHKAIMGKKEAVISHLLRKGASPHVKDKDGATPLHYAVHVGAMQTVKLLLKYNADVNVDDRDGWTPLHIAVQSRNRDIAKVLLINGADKTRKNKDGKTALDLSLCYGRDFKSYDLAKLLKILPADRYL
ncbi:ankyrin repeat domain-containing protein EMB506, chloroplastic-like [Durio zibethinus]|uniref:Ankyrin repeat domain-containing protein EMB506, chloroplastic-like n=1 Tax=Durio zibethinus TaxID=66656 RepID=A0A6P6BBF5_DURZI|nr:ankyrin repeat domain-containing protein EMB506, chloroplastic-like [Durio zibethinus]